MTGDSSDDVGVTVIGTRMVLRRKGLGLTQAAVGERAGVGQSQVSSWEKGQIVPDIANLIKLADALECSIDYLVGRTDEPQTVAPGAAEKAWAIVSNLARAGQGNPAEFDELLAHWEMIMPFFAEDGELDEGAPESQA